MRSILTALHVWFQAIVRCEDIDISGGIVRQKMKYERFLRKGTNSNPRRGQFHFRAPSQILFRTIRGCVLDLAVPARDCKCDLTCGIVKHCLFTVAGRLRHTRSLLIFSSYLFTASRVVSLVGFL